MSPIRARALLPTGLALGLLLASLLVIRTSTAAFNSSTNNSGSSFAAGTVAVSDNDASTLLFDTTAMLPGDTKTTCVRVDYTGSVAGTIRMYGTSTGNLAQYLNLTLERGTGASGFNNCTGFSSSATVYSGTVSGFASSHSAYSNGAGSYAAATSSNQWFRFIWTLQDHNSAQSQTASATYTWEARSSVSTTNFSATAGSSTVTVPADTLQPPGTPSATYNCTLTVRKITVNWTATPTTWATTYRVYRSVNGGAYSSVTTVNYGTNSWVDTAINGDTTYAYRLRSERTGWTWVSADTAASNSVTTPTLCL